MKREYKETQKVYRKYPLFWRLCDNCEKEFRFESGWISVTPPYQNNVGTRRYLCKECAPTKENAIEYFSDIPWNFSHIEHIIIPPPPKNKSRCTNNCKHL